MAGQVDKSRATIEGEAGVAYRQRLIDRMVQTVGNRASDAVRLTPQEELQRWLWPTSDAAVIALKNGGSIEDAMEANRLSAEDAKQKQAAISGELQQQGATPDEVFKALSQAQLTDDQIFGQHRTYARALGKSNSMGKAAKEADYHARMSARAAEARGAAPTTETVQEAG